MMNKVFSSPFARIGVIFLLLSFSGILYALALQKLSTTTGYEAPHEEQSADSSLIAIKGDDIFQDSNLLPIKGRVLNKIYGTHYEKTELLERSAKFTGDLKVSNDTYTFSLTFLPSSTTYAITIKSKDPRTNDFTMEVKNAH